MVEIFRGCRRRSDNSNSYLVGFGSKIAVLNKGGDSKPQTLRHFGNFIC